MIGKSAAHLLPLAILLAVAGCQSGSPSQALSINTKTAPTDAVARIAKVAQTCWFKSKDRAFRDYRMSNEVNSYAGRPRVLLVRRIDPNGLPLLVIQAEVKGSASSGKYTNIQTYGPLVQTSNGKRIADDVRRWSTGNGDCSA